MVLVLQVVGRRVLAGAVLAGAVLGREGGREAGEEEEKRSRRILCWASRAPSSGYHGKDTDEARPVRMHVGRHL